MLRLSLIFLVSSLVSLWGSAAEEVTLFTFTAPVAVPGKVLPAGKYLFKLDQHEELNVVKVESPDGRKLYGVFVVKPDYRLKAPAKAGLIFEPAAPGSPQVIKAWYYQGDKYGNEFIYRK